MSSAPPLLIYGDPHGEWRTLLRAVREERPGTVVILGDCDLDEPLHTVLKPVFEQGISVRWIIGNHDVDSLRWYDNLVGDHPGGDLSGRVCSAAGYLVAGLGGIFKGKVWYPREGGEQPLYRTRAELLRVHGKGNRFRGGLPLSLRDTILPEDVEAVGQLRADILVAHEAPTSHRHGFGVLDDLARDIGAQLVVHGHHHAPYDGQTRDGIRVQGLGKAEVLLIRSGDLDG